MLEADFNAGASVVKVDYWACSREKHQNDGFQHHCALNLTCCKKWLSIKNRIAKTPGIQANFSGKHNFYLSSYRYICKSDQKIVHNDSWQFGSCFSKNQKISYSISCCLCHKKEVHRRKIFLLCCKEAKNLINLDLAEFIRERVSDATLSSLLLWRSGELLAGYTLLNLYSNEVNKYPVILLPKVN